MCWVALDRGIAMAELHDAIDRVPRWSAEREALCETIVDRGWNDQVRHSPSTSGPPPWMPPCC